MNTYTWNARNQLSQISQGGNVQLAFSYDAMGRRISKTVQGAATQFLYDGNNAVQETQGSTINPILAGLGIDEHFARNDVTGRTYFLTDQLNSTIALTDPTGAVKQQYSYDPYGNVTPNDTSTGFTNPYQFTGREADAPGLYYYRARYYSPALMGFLSEDQVQFGGGQLTFYGYAGGNPTMYRDPSGHLLLEAGVGLIVGGAWGVASGYFSGDTGDQLWHDALVGAGVGALAGLTDGASLLEGASGYALRAGISATGEAVRQEWNYGCVKSVGDVVMAGGLSAFGDMGSDAFSGVLGGASGELSNAARAVSAAGGGTLTGAAQSAIGNVEHGQEQTMNNEVNSAYDNFENSLPH